MCIIIIIRGIRCRQVYHPLILPRRLITPEEWFKRCFSHTPEPIRWLGRQEKYEKLKTDAPKHDFNDTKYIETREMLLDQTNDAFEAGLSTISKKGKCDDEGHKGDEKCEHENENEVNDEGEGDHDDDDIDDEDLPGPSFVGLKRKPHNDSSTNGIKKAKLNEEQNGEEASSNAKRTESSQQSIVDSKQKQDSNTTNGLLINAKVEVENSNVSKNKGEPLPKDVAQEDKSQELIDINVDEYDSVESLSALGLDRLKYALEARGLKCGGSLDERAKRLFSVKGLKANEYPKSLLASHSKKRH